MPRPSPPDLVLVGLQSVLLAGVLFAPAPFAVSVPGAWRLGFTAVKYLAVGFGAVAALQLGSGLTPWPTPRAGARLVTTGVFALVRHPIYAALLALCFASALASGSPVRLLFALALFVLIRRKVRYEEGLLARRYADYAAYAKRVKRFGV